MTRENKSENKASKAEKRQYTIIAKITEMKNGGKVLLSGAGKYAYTKDENTKWIIFEGNSPESSKFISEKSEFIVDCENEIEMTILATAMINKKALKLTVEESSAFTIISIKNP